MRILFLALGSVICLSACSGYHLRGQKNDYLEERGIRKVYLAPVKNNSFKPGVENGLYNALIKKISAYNIVTLVQDPATADAILEGTVAAASYTSDPSQILSGKTLSNNYPQPALPASQIAFTPDLFVTLQYTAVLTANFSLTRTRIKKLGDNPEVIWAGNLSRGRAFTANNQPGVYGTTAAHINDSEFNRTLGDLTDQIADQVHESMVSMF